MKKDAILKFSAREENQEVTVVLRAVDPKTGTEMSKTSLRTHKEDAADKDIMVASCVRILRDTAADQFNIEDETEEEPMVPIVRQFIKGGVRAQSAST